MCIANIRIDFSHWKYVIIILSFFLYSLGENKFMWKKKPLPFNMKLINTVQNYPYIIESYACVL